MTDTFSRLTTALADRYTIEREIGAGGMATVYLARDLKHERQVAIKVLRPELAASLGPDRFLQEIRIAANLHHPHIMPLFDSGRAVGRTGGQAEGSSGEFLFYVMPYVTGESLREKLAKEGELPVSDAVRILKEVVDALAKAHSEGVVHRDIKPDNVMLADRHALVTDFGVAKAVSEATGHHKLTTEGIALGTPAYMAPEQAAADPLIDHRADVYAVGVLAYELLTGRPPFTGTTQQEILAAHVTQAADPVTKYRENVPPVLAQLVMKCLEKKPADRWQTAGELIPQLETLATPSGGLTPTGMVPARGGTGSRPRLYLVLTTVAVIAAAIGGIMKVLPGSTAEPGNRRIAVAPLANRTGDPEFDMYGRWAATTITQGLQQTGIGEVVPSNLIDEALANAGGVSGDPVSQLSELTGAGIVVTGEVFRAGDSLELNAEIYDAVAGQVLYATDFVRSTVPEARDALSTLSLRVAAALESHLEWSGRGVDQTTVSPPANLEAFREFSAGIEMYQRNYTGLIHFQRAQELDSSFVGPVEMAILVHLNAGEYRLADSLCSLLQSSRYQLSPFERATLGVTQASLRGDAEGAYRAAVDRFDLNRTGAYSAGNRAANTNRLEAALEFYGQMDMSLPWEGEWFGSWSQPAQVLHRLGRYEEELQLTAEIRERFPDRSTTTTYLETRALIALGRLDEMAQRGLSMKVRHSRSRV